MIPDIIVTTSNKHLWALQPFAWLFNKYWNTTTTKVIVVGYKVPDFAMPGNFSFYSIADEEYPANKWVDGTLKFFSEYHADRFIFMHEDYWLTRKADIDGIAKLAELSRSDENLFRVDLTADRLYAGGMRDAFSFDRFDMVEAPASPYQMSHQAGIFNTEQYVKLLSSLREDCHSAWSVELEGTTFVNLFGDRMRVLGTRQCPIRYCNALLKGKLDWAEIPKLETGDYKAILQWIPEDILHNKPEDR
jgi:hypothetical protein